MNKYAIAANKKYDIAFYSLGNGITVCNRAVIEHGDFKKVAHIDVKRNVTFHDKSLPTEVKRNIISVAKTSDTGPKGQPETRVFETKPAKFKVGDVVNYTNDNGVDLGNRTIIAVDSVAYSDSGYGYYVEPTDTPWYAIKEENLTIL